MSWLQENMPFEADDIEYLTEVSIYEFNELLTSKMKELAITRTQLAQRLGVSKSLITQILNGNPNMTIKTMVSLATALGCRINLDIYPKDFELKRKALYVYTNEGYSDFIPVLNEADNALAA
jgi:transcriptional regulator with XRE-family HTH domain